MNERNRLSAAALDENHLRLRTAIVSEYCSQIKWAGTLRS